MFNSQRKLKTIALVFGVLFAIGMTQLFWLRFEAGNIYPAYSSLRSDPLGTRALYESLNRLSKETASRNFRPLRQVDLDSKTTLMLVGLPETGSVLHKNKIETLLDQLVQKGGRLVMTFTGTLSPGRRHDSDAMDKTDSRKDEATVDADPIEEFVEEEDKDGSNVDGPEAANALNALGIRIHSIDDAPAGDVAVRFTDDPAVLPSDIPWRSPLYFELQENGWETVYTWQEAPVLIQRPWGRGTVVMAADSYLLSNEALRNHRSSGLLAWLVVPGHRILFDEYHKGLAKQPGIAGLARQYRLQWVFAALLAVAVLFVWRQTAIFIPSVQSEQGLLEAMPVVGRDTSQGLVHLSRQHIRPKELLTVCFQAWKSQAAQAIPQSRVDEVKALVEQSAIDPRKEVHVETYKQIYELLKQGKRS